MNIFEDFFNKKMTVEEFVSLVSVASDDSELKEGFQTFNPNSPEEYLTQIFTHIMLKDASFRKAFLEKLEIADGEWDFNAEYSYSEKSNVKKNTEKGEMDVFGTSKPTKSLLIIENKLNSEIDLDQPNKYAKFFASHKDYSTKYVVVLTKFSGLITYWNSYEGGIKEKIVSALQNKIDKEIGKGKYICKHIYWHEVYTLLENNFTDTEMQQELLVFMKSQNLDKDWYQDMGCPFWRKDFIEEFNKFAQDHKLPKKQIPEPIQKDGSPNIRTIELPGEGNYFGGARIQGARRAEAYKNYSLLQINVNGKTKDLSKYIDDPAECIKQSAEMILDAYGKNSL